MELLTDIVFVYLTLYWINILMYCVLLGLIPAAIARNKGYSFGKWWLYGSFLFIVALPHSILLKPNKVGIERKRLEEGFRKCPFCAEFINKNAVICRFCGRSLPEEIYEEINENPEEIDIVKCLKCAEKIEDPKAIFCSKCGAKLIPETPEEELINADSIDKYLR